MVTNPLTGKRPDNLGVMHGRLAACPQTNNCVSSQADDVAHYVEPLSAPDLAGATMMERLASAVQACEEVEIVSRTNYYLHAECRSTLGFVDDLELFWSDVEGVCHVRSASRLGLTDLGKNRARVEKLRTLLAGWGFCE